MHCETSEEPASSWRESWHALERAYAEGHIASIGVSNFDHRLLAGCASRCHLTRSCL